MRKLLVVALLLAAQSVHAAVIPATIQTTKGAIVLQVETALTPSERAIGLMNRKALAPNDGMLFVFPRVVPIAFWMKNTLIPLDMLFIGTDGKIGHIQPNATPESTTPIDSTLPVAVVIEIDGGRAEKQGIAVGDAVHFTLPKGRHAQ